MPDPLTIAAVAAPFIGAGMQAFSAKSQMRFQERMSNTALQRMTADARAAGINPLFVAGSGGASSPVGAQADVGSAPGDAVSSALHVKMNRQQLENMRTERAESLQRQATGASQDLLNRSLKGEAEARTAKELAETELVRSGLTEAKNREAAAGTRFGKVLTQIQRVREAVFGGSPGVLLQPPGRNSGKANRRPVRRRN